MNGFLLLIPFLLIRFVLLSVVSTKAAQRASHFAPVQGKEKAAYYIYQISTIGIVLYPIFLTIEIERSWKVYLGVMWYLLGLCLCVIVMINFSFPDHTGMNTNGIYKISRNPMYIAYFVCFIGIALLTQSVVLFVIVLIFQISAHWVILAEERWCIEKFGESYRRYMKNVRRYI